MKAKSTALYRLIVTAISVTFLTLCAWITVPFLLNFTLQLFAVFLIAAIFPPSMAICSIGTYTLIGILGVPVFSGFNSGISALLGASGGFIIAFIPATLIISAFNNHYCRHITAYIITASVSLVLCYTVGCIWYMYVFCYPTPCSVWTAITVCVLPFAVFDILKISLSAVIFKKIRPYIDRLSL